MSPDQIAHIDKVLEPKMTPEQEAEAAAAKVAYEQEVLQEKWESWGTSPEAQAQQAAMMDMMAGFEE